MYAYCLPFENPGQKSSEAIKYTFIRYIALNQIRAPPPVAAAKQRTILILLSLEKSCAAG